MNLAQYLSFFFLIKKGKLITHVCNIHCSYKNMMMCHVLTNGVVAEPKKETSTVALLQKFIDKLMTHLFVIPSIKVPKKKSFN